MTLFITMPDNLFAWLVLLGAFILYILPFALIVYLIRYFIRNKSLEKNKITDSNA